MNADQTRIVNEHMSNACIPTSLTGCDCTARYAAAADNPFAQLERVTPADVMPAKAPVEREDHRTPVQKRLDQARVNAQGFPRGLRRF